MDLGDAVGGVRADDGQVAMRTLFWPFLHQADAADVVLVAGMAHAPDQGSGD